MTRSLIARMLVGAGLAGIAVVTIGNVRHRATTWTPAELAMLRSLSLRSLEPLGSDASNRYADDARAAALGRDLFFDTRLSGNGKVSCATCHVATQGFQDGKPLADGVGRTARRTMPIAGTAHSPWLFWDGRTDSQWAQALGSSSPSSGRCPAGSPSRSATTRRPTPAHNRTIRISPRHRYPCRGRLLRRAPRANSAEPATAMNDADLLIDREIQTA